MTRGTTCSRPNTIGAATINATFADAAVRFAASVTQQRGHVSDAELQAVRQAGYTDAQIIEIVQHVALNTWTHCINEVARTNIDFPVVGLNRAA